MSKNKLRRELILYTGLVAIALVLASSQTKLFKQTFAGLLGGEICEEKQTCVAGEPICEMKETCTTPEPVCDENGENCTTPEPVCTTEEVCTPGEEVCTVEEVCHAANCHEECTNCQAGPEVCSDQEVCTSVPGEPVCEMKETCTTPEEVCDEAGVCTTAEPVCTTEEVCTPGAETQTCETKPVCVAGEEVCECREVCDAETPAEEPSITEEPAQTFTDGQYTTKIDGITIFFRDTTTGEDVLEAQPVAVSSFLKEAGMKKTLFVLGGELMVAPGEVVEQANKIKAYYDYNEQTRAQIKDVISQVKGSPAVVEETPVVESATAEPEVAPISETTEPEMGIGTAASEAILEPEPVVTETPAAE